MAFYFYWQQNGGEEPWQEALSDGREVLITSKKPRFTTILDLDTLVVPRMSVEDMVAIKYRGPFYVDFDGSDIDTVLPKFKQFIGKLQEAEVDLNACSFYASGKKGFHITIPIEVFLPKPPKNGIQFLPAIYKEIAEELYVDTLDLRVYSARRGRMFRTVNVQRENGGYKVPLTPDEALALTAEQYPEYCSAPRELPELAKPALNQALAVLYARAEQRVAAAAKRKKDPKVDLELLSRYKGDFPPSLLKVMAGEGTAEKMGFNQIAMQIAITANALGKKEDEVLALCAGLIENHVSDGSRYNTPGKRREELLHQLRYTNGNPCYSYSRSAVRRLVPENQPSPDLDGLPEEAGEVTGAGANGNDDGLMGGVFMTEAGVYRSNEDGVMKISDVSFKDVTMLSDAYTSTPLGYEAEVIAAGRSKGHRLLDTSIFLSRANFQKFAMQHRGVFTGNDNQAAVLSVILRDTAMQNEGIVYVVSREGLDLIQRPDTSDSILDFLWVANDTVYTSSPVTYKYRGAFTKDGEFKSDLMRAPEMKASEEAAQAIEALLQLNVPYVVGNVLGWMVSCFHKQVYHYIYNQFPLLMVFGQAGSGKSSLAEAFLFLHYYLQRPLYFQSDRSTIMPIEAALQGSASIPCVLEEYKPTEMRPGRHAQLKHMLRSAYNSQTFSKGGMAHELGTTWRDIRTFSYSAPVFYIGEMLESETAIMERTVAVPVQKAGLTGREEALQTVRDSRHVLSSLGRSIAQATFGLKFPEFRAKVDGNMQRARDIAFKANNQRPIFNLAVVMTGLDFFDHLLSVYFQDRFRARMDELRTAVCDISQHVAMTVMPEASKALNALALISNTEEAASEFGLKYGQDYVYHTDDLLDVKVRNCYVKYIGWCKRKGLTPHFGTEEAFMHGLSNYAPLRNKVCADSAMKVTGMEKVFRFHVPSLVEEGVEPFKRV